MDKKTYRKNFILIVVASIAALSLIAFASSYSGYLNTAAFPAFTSPPNFIAPTVNTAVSTQAPQACQDDTFVNLEVANCRASGCTAIVAERYAQCLENGGDQRTCLSEKYENADECRAICDTVVLNGAIKTCQCEAGLMSAYNTCQEKANSTYLAKWSECRNLRPYQRKLKCEEDAKAQQTSAQNACKASYDEGDKKCNFNVSPYL